MSKEKKNVPDSNDVEFEDINSSSKSSYDVSSHVGEYVEKYGNGIFKNLGMIIKCLAFIICFTVIVISFIGAYFIFSFDPLFIAIAAGIVVVGTIIGLIFLFLIYGMGHIICQNNEILTRLNKRQ